MKQYPASIVFLTKWLRKDYGFSSGQLDRLRKNENVSTFTPSRLCEILHCRIEDIAEYKK